jgi:hypothetical protein
MAIKFFLETQVKSAKLIIQRLCKESAVRNNARRNSGDYSTAFEEELEALRMCRTHRFVFKACAEGRW